MKEMMTVFTGTRHRDKPRPFRLDAYGLNTANGRATEEVMLSAGFEEFEIRITENYLMLTRWKGHASARRCPYILNINYKRTRMARKKEEKHQTYVEHN
ncbi:hypothetical protein EYF80_058332 [Liparis tanakae]|uniref:Uncharacterized protein n=1 Tax=Liparis tanakae TaxID=230148 RepID=A0A4Z2ERP5_9TELE|nr:hypothetical protein EYF80_058332 [Liparis tanakae]